jgi:hypothetical protein
MRNARFGLMAGLAGATLCLFAVTSYAQNPTTDPNAGTATPQATGTGTATTPQTTQPATTGTGTTPGVTGTESRTTATDVTTTTSTTRTFPGGVLGIVAVAVIVLLVLFALFRGRDRTVVRESYASSSAAAPPASRTVSTGTAADDRLNVNSRAASGTGTNSGGMNDPNARR